VSQRQHNSVIPKTDERRNVGRFQELLKLPLSECRPYFVPFLQLFDRIEGVSVYVFFSNAKIKKRPPCSEACVYRIDRSAKSLLMFDESFDVRVPNLPNVRKWRTYISETSA
jgi:hypothetical protein